MVMFGQKKVRSPIKCCPSLFPLGSVAFSKHQEDARISLNVKKTQPGEDRQTGFDLEKTNRQEHLLL